MSSMENDHVLVIEGSVMYGFAGTKCVQFALQVMGFDVCAIIPDNYSVHFFYEQYSAVHFTVDDLDKTYSALRANGLHKRFTHIITGYTETCEMLSKMVEIVKDLKACNPDIIYICDPVIGDNSDNYKTMPDDLRLIYRDALIPIADITTPNQFEVEFLSGMKIHTQEEALKAIQRLHERGPSIVIMTSSTLEHKDVLTTIGSCWKNGKREAYRLEYPRIDAYLVGTGDLFAGSFTGLLRKTDDMKTSLEKAISIMQIVCQRTYRDAKERAGQGNTLTPDLLELRVAQCAPFIMNPQIIYPATKLL